MEISALDIRSCVEGVDTCETPGSPVTRFSPKIGLNIARPRIEMLLNAPCSQMLLNFVDSSVTVVGSSQY